MKLIDKIVEIFKKREKISYIDELNSQFNNAFNKVFNKCRFEFGTELINITNIKNGILENINKNGIAGKELIANRFFSLLMTYLNLLENYVDLKNSLEKEEKKSIDVLENSKYKIEQIYSLIQNISLQIKLNCYDAFEKYADEVNEAIALSNVLDIKRKILD